MANLSFNQISAILNGIVAFNSDESTTNTVLSADLSNIVDFGKSVTASGIDWSTTANSLMNKITKQVILSTDFVSSAPDIFVEGENWAGVTEVYRVLINKFADSNFFDPVTADSTAGTYYRNDSTICSKLFGIEMPTIKSKYFEKTLTYLKSVTIAPTQFANAFISASAMSQFINEIWNKVAEQWSFAKDCLSYLAFDIAIARTLYERTTFGTDETTCNSITLKDWTDSTGLYSKVMGIMRQFKQYNNYASASDYISSVTDDNLVCYMRADLYDSLVPVLSELTMNKGAVAGLIEKFRPITTWTGEGTEDDIELSVTALEDSTGTAGKTKIEIRNINYIIMDKRLVACTADNKKVTSQYNPLTDTTNYFHTAILKYRVNDELPLIVECDTNTMEDAIKLS